MNKQGTWSGHTDTPLADEGHEQAKLAGKRAKDQGLTFDVIVSSPLQRAHHTAKHVAKHIEYPHDEIVLHDMFKERYFGALEGKKNRWIRARYAFNEGAIDKHKDVETMEELQKRAEEALAYLYTLDHDTVLVVAHGSFGRALYRAVNGIPPTPKRIIRYKNAELVKLI
jgi:broad specificity phosphatase PhoE